MDLECEAIVLFISTTKWSIKVTPKLPTAIPDEPSRTAQCVPHPPPAVISSPRIPRSRRGAGGAPRTPASVARVHTLSYVILVVGANHVSQFSEKVALSINSMH